MASSSSSSSTPATSSSPSILQFTPLPTQISADFWHTLSTLKLDRLRLDEAPLPLRASYGVARRVKDRSTGEEVAVQGSLVLDEGSLDARPSEGLQANGGVGDSATATSSSTAAAASISTTPHPLLIPAHGTLRNYNTAVSFTSSDKNALFNSMADEILQDLLTSPDPLRTAVLRFTVLAFADLKKHKFYHWAALPALVAKPSWVIGEGGWSWLGEGEKGVAVALREHVDKYAGSVDAGFALVKTRKQQGDATAGSGYELSRISDWPNFFSGAEEAETPTVLFVDPSSHESAPGWPLRNLLALLSVRWGVKKVKIICWRDGLPSSSSSSSAAPTPGSQTTSASLVGTVFLPPHDSTTEGLVQLNGSSLPLAHRPTLPTSPAAIGWERNHLSKLAPRVSDLGPLMDPKRLADQAVDLNLKLMRWRILPEIDLDIVRSTRCLLLGAGTLGCYVARLLLAWGVREVTLVDSGRVSFSNPVRQPLFDFEDCVQGGREKAQCAAEKLGKIFPGVKATGISLSVPMPGHGGGASSSSSSSERDVATLEKLFDEHDVVYLLMDSRESRWLPTMLGAAKGKMVINAALGFDTYLVMRHGAGPVPADREGKGKEEQEAPTQVRAPSYSKSPERLGCYFCNDVVAPADSLTDRTLDQMCTVTRPGLAAIAAASAVELMVSLLQHPKRERAPAPPPTSRDNEENDDAKCCLGTLPHQLRGYLSGFSTRPVTGAAFDRCTACSSRVVEAYREEGWGMVRKALGEDEQEGAGYLERLTGLDKMYEETERLLLEEGGVGEDGEGWGSEEGEEGEE